MCTMRERRHSVNVTLKWLKGRRTLLEYVCAFLSLTVNALLRVRLPWLGELRRRHFTLSAAVARPLRSALMDKHHKTALNMAKFIQG